MKKIFSKLQPTDLTAGFLILALPFVILYWLVPGVANLTIGNDYVIFPIQQQIEMAFSLKHGTFPLWVPGFAMGRSQAALTMGQLFHPISHLAAMIPGYWDGAALSINTVLRLISLGLTQLFLFALLRKLALPLWAALVISTLGIYNMRMLDLFRYGASLENYTGMMLFCTAIGFGWLKEGGRATLLAMVGAGTLLLTGGHPQMMYLGLLGAGIATLFIPFVLHHASPENTRTPTAKNVFKFYGTVLVALLLAMALAAPYLLSFYIEFVADNALRVGQDYQWSLAYGDTVGGALASLFAPLEGDVHGAFGASPLFLLAAAAPLAALLGEKVPRSIWLINAAMILIFLCLLGTATPVHKLFWRYVPLAQTFRTPGRMSMMLPFLVVLTLLWLTSSANRQRWFTMNPITPHRLLLPSIISLAAFAAYHLFLAEQLPPPSRYTPTTIIGEKMRDGALLRQLQQVAIPACKWLGATALLLTTALGGVIGSKRRLIEILLGSLLLVATITETTVVLRHGTWQTTPPAIWTATLLKTQKERNPGFSGAPGFGMESPLVTEQMSKGTLEPQLARFYRNIITARDHADAFAKMAKFRRNNNAVVESVNNLDQHGPEGRDEITLTFNSANRFDFDVTAGHQGVLCLNQPNDGRWHAQVDGKETPVLRANGLESAVLLPPGNHQVSFRYESPSTTLGVVVATLTLILLSMATAWSIRQPKVRWGTMAACIILPILFSANWATSRYGGDSIGTRYHWTTPPPAPKPNLAFGHPTAASSIKSFQMPYFYYAGLAVDGDKTGRGFTTNPRQARPWWQVDLGRPTPVDEVVVYDRQSGRRHLPLTILTSKDGRRFSVVHTEQRRPLGPAWKIHLNGIEGRFWRLQSGGRGPMSFSEVEIFAADRKAAPALTDETDPTGNLRFQQKTRR